MGTNSAIYEEQYGNCQQTILFHVTNVAQIFWDCEEFVEGYLRQQQHQKDEWVGERFLCFQLSLSPQTSTRTLIACFVGGSTFGYSLLKSAMQLSKE